MRRFHALTRRFSVFHFSFSNGGFPLHYHKRIGALAMAFLIAGGLASIDARTILLVPQDDRPVSLDYTVSTAEKAGYTVLTPPKGYLSGKNYQGSPDQVWRWVEQHMREADAAVI